MKQQLFDYFAENHDLLLLENEQQTVVDRLLDEGNTHGWTQRVEKGEPVLCVVWDGEDNVDDGVRLVNIVALNTDRSTYITPRGREYDYAEPVSDALVRSYQKWGKWICQ